MFAVPDTFWEDEFESEQYHIGLRDFGENQWRWPDLELASNRLLEKVEWRLFEAWTPYNNYHLDHKCAVLTTYECQNTRMWLWAAREEQCWEKIDCEAKRPFICEI